MNRKNALRILMLALMLLAIAVLAPSGAARAEGGLIVYDDVDEDEAVGVLIDVEPTPVPLPQWPTAQIAPLPVDDKPAPKPDANAYTSEFAYDDGSLRVSIEPGRANDTNYLVARVRIADPSQLRTATAGGYYSTYTCKGFLIANRVNSVLAINGDFYNYRNDGYVVRQGTVVRNRPNGFDALLIDDKGDFHVVEYADRKTLDAFLENFDGEIVNAMSFGPLLVRDGKRVEEIHYFDVGTNKPTQRMGIAQVGPLEYLCVSTEGPEDPGSRGFTVAEFADLMEEIGCEIAYNLDGGSSNTMVWRGEKLNSPDNPKERYIGDIIYFATAVAQ